MIKNNHQYKRTKGKIEEMNAAKLAFMEENLDDTTAQYTFGINSFDAIICDLEQQIKAYECLCQGGIQLIQPASLDELPRAIIQARIALGYTQKEFAEKTGLKEQQIQRYEAEDYQGISFDRMLDFTEALGITFHIQKTFIATKRTDVFSYSDSITEDCIAIEVEKVKERRSLLIA
jgi:HTH-type transcriptional regulator/antitoxin HipB